MSSHKDKPQLLIPIAAGAASEVLVLIIVVVIACFIKTKQTRTYSLLLRLFLELFIIIIFHPMITLSKTYWAVICSTGPTEKHGTSNHHSRQHDGKCKAQKLQNYYLNVSLCKIFLLDFFGNKQKRTFWFLLYLTKSPLTKCLHQH